MTDIDITAIRRRADAATSGPWIGTTPHDGRTKWADDFEDPMVVTADSSPGNYCAIAQEICNGPTDGQADAEFIAAARTDVPALLDLVAEQATEIERLRAGAESVIAGYIAAGKWAVGVGDHGSAAECEAVVEKIRRDILGGKPAEQQYLIWSQHHKTWWGPNGSGYRSHIADAGRYALADTAQWLTRGCGDCLVPEVVIAAPPAGLHGAALDQYGREQIRRAIDAAIAEDRINRHVKCGEVGTSFNDGSEPINTEPCELTLDHEGPHDWAQREAEAVKGQPHYHDPIECGCELTADDAPVEFGPAQR
jgi:hypothetical protein